MSSPLTVGIAGGTGAGKSSICDVLCRTLDGVTILDLESADLVMQSDRDLAACVAAVRDAMQAMNPAAEDRCVPTA
jgi:uridine kinase